MRERPKRRAPRKAKPAAGARPVRGELVRVAPIPGVLMRELSRGVPSVIDAARSLRVVDATTLAIAVDLDRRLAGYEEKVALATDGLVKATNAAHRMATQQRAMFLGTVPAARADLRRRMGRYEEEREAERLRLEREADAERVRLQALADSYAEELTEGRRSDAELERERLADEADARGDRALARQIRRGDVTVVPATPAVVFAPPLPEPEAMPEGLGFREEWYAEVTDLRKLALAVGEGRASEGYVEGAEKALNKVAAALKDKMDVPGVEAKMRKVPVDRGPR